MIYMSEDFDLIYIFIYFEDKIKNWQKRQAIDWLSLFNKKNFFVGLYKKSIDQLVITVKIFKDS